MTCIFPKSRLEFSLITLLITLSLPAQAQTKNCPSEGLWMQVLGSGGPEVQDQRASSSYLIWIDGEARILVDAGGGSALRFGQSGARMETLDAVVFSHLHVDHSADFPALIKSSFFEQRKTPLPVLGPQGNQFLPSTRDFVKRLFSDQGVWPYLGHFLPKQRHFAYEIQTQNVAADEDQVAEVFSNPRLRLSAIRVHHGPLPALAWRVDLSNGGSVTFSGDMSGEYGLLPKLAKDSDLLVAHNAIAEDTRGVARRLHMPPSVIGELARQSRIGTLVLSHFMLRSLPVQEQTQQIIRQSFSGPVEFSSDLACYPITATGKN